MQKRAKKSDEQRHSSLKFDYAKYKAEEARNKSQVIKKIISKTFNISKKNSFSNLKRCLLSIHLKQATEIYHNLNKLTIAEK